MCFYSGNNTSSLYCSCCTQMTAASHRKKMKLLILALLTCIVASASGKKLREPRDPGDPTTPEPVTVVDVPMDATSISVEVSTEIPEGISDATATSEVETFAIVNGKCADQYPATCWSWKNQGYCTNTYYYGTQYVMTDLCPVTCGRCGELTRTAAAQTAFFANKILCDRLICIISSIRFKVVPM
jgi:hypothetical protein